MSYNPFASKSGIAAFNHAGTHIAFAYDNNITVFDATTYQIINTFTDFFGISTLSFNYTDDVIIALSGTHILLIDMNTKQVREINRKNTFIHGSKISYWLMCLAVSSINNDIYFGCLDGIIRVLNIDRPSEFVFIRDVVEDRLMQIVLNADCTQYALLTRTAVKIFDCKNTLLLKKKNKCRFTRIACNDSTCIIGTTYDSKLIKWNMVTNEIHTLATDLDRPLFEINNRYIACTSGSKILIYDINSNKIVRTILDHIFNVEYISMSNFNSIVSCSFSRNLVHQIIATNTKPALRKSLSSETVNDSATPTPLKTVNDLAEPISLETANDSAEPTLSKTVNDLAEPIPLETTNDSAKPTPSETANDTAEMNIPNLVLDLDLSELND